MSNFAEKLQQDIDNHRENQANIQNRALDNPVTGYHRCSSIHDVLRCQRKQFFKVNSEYSRQQKKWYNPYMVGLFEIGNTLETSTRRILEDIGYKIKNEQRPISRLELINAKISGSSDFVIIKNGIEVLAEVKSINEFDYAKISCWQDILMLNHEWTENWITQVNCYQYDQEAKFSGEPAVFIFINKSSGEIKVIPLPMDVDLVNRVIESCQDVNSYLERNEIPPAIPFCHTCENCKWYGTACLPDMKFTATDNEIVDPGAIEILQKIEALKEEALPAATAIQKEYDGLKKSLKAFFEPYQTGSYFCAGKELTVKEITRKPTAGCTYREVGIKGE